MSEKEQDSTKCAATENDVHCIHWFDCMPCCLCGDDTPDPDADCHCDKCTTAKEGGQ